MNTALYRQVEDRRGVVHLTDGGSAILCDDWSAYPVGRVERVPDDETCPDCLAEAGAA